MKISFARKQITFFLRIAGGIPPDLNALFDEILRSNEWVERVENKPEWVCGGLEYNRDYFDFVLHLCQPGDGIVADLREEIRGGETPRDQIPQILNRFFKKLNFPCPFIMPNDRNDAIPV